MPEFHSDTLGGPRDQHLRRRVLAEPRGQAVAHRAGGAAHESAGG